MSLLSRYEFLPLDARHQQAPRHLSRASRPRFARAITGIESSRRRRYASAADWRDDVEYFDARAEARLRAFASLETYFISSACQIPHFAMLQSEVLLLRRGMPRSQRFGRFLRGWLPRRADAR